MISIVNAQVGISTILPILLGILLVLGYSVPGEEFHSLIDRRKCPLRPDRCHSSLGPVLLQSRATPDLSPVPLHVQTVAADRGQVACTKLLENFDYAESTHKLR